MWRISLVDDQTQKVFELPRDYSQGLQQKHTATSAPLSYCEAFNFKGVLDGRDADSTLLAIDAFIERWKHCRNYSDDRFAPTMGNVRQVMEQLSDFARRHPDGTWKVES